MQSNWNEIRVSWSSKKQKKKKTSKHGHLHGGLYSTLTSLTSILHEHFFSQVRNLSKFSPFEAPIVDEGAKRGTNATPVTYDRRLETRAERSLWKNTFFLGRPSNSTRHTPHVMINRSLSPLLAVVLRGMTLRLFRRMCVPAACVDSRVKSGNQATFARSKRPPRRPDRRSNLRKHWLPASSLSALILANNRCRID